MIKITTCVEDRYEIRICNDGGVATLLMPDAWIKNVLFETFNEAMAFLDNFKASLDLIGVSYEVVNDKFPVKESALTVSKLIALLQKVNNKEAVVVLCHPDYEYAEFVGMEDGSNADAGDGDIGNVELNISHKTEIAKKLLSNEYNWRSRD